MGAIRTKIGPKQPLCLLSVRERMKVRVQLRRSARFRIPPSVPSPYEQDDEGKVRLNPVSFRHSERVLLCVILSGVCGAKNHDSSPPVRERMKVEGPDTARVSRANQDSAVLL